jgi:SAM-dependent methyltransferase
MNIARLIAMQITPDRLRMRGQKLLRIVQESTVGLARNLIYGWHHRADVSRYHIIAGYRHRSHAIYFDDTHNTDEWQKEVYQYAAELMRSECMQVVHDVGCGSGHKLIHYLGEYQTVGYDVEQTVSFLRSNYSNREWRVIGSDIMQDKSAELVICADVIEHVINPDSLLNFLDGLATRFIILSTPDRDLVCARGSYHYFGPPRNPAHIREWNRREFRQYIAETFDIIEHRIANRLQGTQVLLCKPRNSQPVR